MKELSLLRDKIAVRVDEPETAKNGILLPDAAQKRPQEGLVVAAGPDCWLIGPGCRVLFSKYGGSDVTINGQRLTILDEEQVFAILSSSATVEV